MTACHALATHYNVSHPARITAEDVVAAFRGGHDELLRDVIWDAEPDALIAVQYETGLDWQPLKSRLQAVLPETHELRQWLDDDRA
jgi:hypothetical protein